MTPESTDSARTFYDGYVEEHVPYHLSPHGLKGFVLRWLPYWSYQEWRFWRRRVPAGCRLLDLGSARGREIFRERARLAVGVDLAQVALRDCARHYDLAALADLRRLPFRDGSFDCIVSSHVMGHVPLAAKEDVLAEVARLLRPGGVTAHVIETDSKHPLVRLAKREPEQYRRRLIEPDGHVGLELVPAVVERFRRHGLVPVEATPLDTGPFHPRLIVKWFGNEYAERDEQFARLVRSAKATLRWSFRLALVEIWLGARQRLLGRWEAPDRAQFLALFCRKSVRKGRGTVWYPREK
jgi:SAM-dependent methyltransferase